MVGVTHRRMEKDGQKFLFTSSSSSWITSARALLRYGPLSPFRTRHAISSLLKKFMRLYDPSWLHDRGVTDSIEEFVEAVGLGREYTTRSGESWAREVVRAGERWVGEVWEGNTRTNVSRIKMKISLRTFAELSTVCHEH